MKFINLTIFCSIFMITAASVSGQCCCASMSFEFRDKHDKTIPFDKLKVENITVRKLEQPISADYAPKILFDVHCGSGREILRVTYKGRVMTLHFRVVGDFGHADGIFKFQEGDFIVKPNDGPVPRPQPFSMSLQKASKDDLSNEN